MKEAKKTETEATVESEAALLTQAARRYDRQNCSKSWNGPTLSSIRCLASSVLVLTRVSSRQLQRLRRLLTPLYEERKKLIDTDV